MRLGPAGLRKLGDVWNRVGYVPAKGFRMRIISDRMMVRAMTD